MRIAILGIKTYPAIAGADRVVESLINNYSTKNEYDIYLLKKEGVPLLECRDNLHFVYIPSLRGKHLSAFVYFFLCSLHFLCKSSCRVVHVHNSDFGLFSLLIRLKGKVKVLSTFHGNPYLRNKWGFIARNYLMLSEWGFLAASHHITSVAQSKLGEIPARYKGVSEYIPNGIEPVEEDSLVPVDLTRWGVEPGAFIMFACGRLDSTKGLHHLLQAYVVGGFREQLLVIGDFSHDQIYSDSIRATAKQHPNIILHEDLLPKEKLLYVLRQCKVFVFPSEVEAMSMMLLEAIASRVPVVCSDIIENTDITGTDYPYLFKSGNASDLEKTMTRIAADADARSKTSALFEEIKMKFNWKTIAMRYEQIYEKLSISKG